MLKLHVIGAFQGKALARLGRGGDGVAKLGEDGLDLDDLLGIGGGQFAASDGQAVLQPHPGISPQQHILRGEWQLVTPGCQYGPLEIVAEQALRGAHEM